MRSSIVWFVAFSMLNLSSFAWAEPAKKDSVPGPKTIQTHSKSDAQDYLTYKKKSAPPKAAKKLKLPLKPVCKEPVPTPGELGKQQAADCEPTLQVR